MKIAVVGLLHNPIAQPFAGGMESHTWWLAKKLIEKGHDVSLFANEDSDPALGLVRCEGTGSEKQAGQTPEDSYERNRLAYTKLIQRLHHDHFDVIHNNALYPFLLLSAIELSAPMLTVLHSPPYKELAVAVRRATALDTTNCLSLVAVSNCLANEWQFIISTGVIYNGIDMSQWPYIADAPLGRALWYGRIVPEKGAHLAIAAALEAGYEIDIAGPISNESYFREKIEPLLAHRDVHYLGHLSHDDIKRVLANVSVFVSTPLWKEPYGIVYAEALASGTPVAALNNGAASEILTARCGVLAKGESVGQLAQAIQSAAKLSRQDCRRRAETFCNIDNMIDGYEQRYLQLINNHQLINHQLIVEQT